MRARAPSSLHTHIQTIRTHTHTEIQLQQKNQLLKYYRGKCNICFLKHILKSKFVKQTNLKKWVKYS